MTWFLSFVFQSNLSQQKGNDYIYQFNDVNPKDFLSLVLIISEFHFKFWNHLEVDFFTHPFSPFQVSQFMQFDRLIHVLFTFKMTTKTNIHEFYLLFSLNGLA
jgi:hypothetical protein